jgi:hypothetical protein
VLVQSIADKGKYKENAYRYPTGLNGPGGDFQKKQTENEKDYSVRLQAAEGGDEDYKRYVKKDLYLREQGLS